MTLLLLSTSILNAQIFGDIAMLIQVIQKKSVSYQEKLDASNSAMTIIDLPNVIQDDVRDFLKKT
tara:strand:+ start:137 stop:331 length:195 start_codon:yes stop_codon:yes gene_type:complete